MPSTDAHSDPGWARLASWAMACAVFAFVVAGSLGRAHQLLSPFGVDDAYFLQRAWLGAHDPMGELTLLATEIGRGTFGGHHHSPIIGVFVPVAALFRTCSSLLVAQAAIVALGVLPLFALCWRSARDRGIAVLLLLAALSAPGFLEIPIVDFRLITPALVLVPAAVGAAVWGRWPMVLAATVLCCSAREGCAPLLLACLPWLMWERARRSSEPRAWLVPLLALGVPALLWYAGTQWRMVLSGSLLRVLPGEGLGLGGALRWAVDLFASDLRGERGEPMMVLRLLRVMGAACLLFVLRPLALLPFGLYWFGAALHSGGINPGQVHYFAPLVGVALALVPLALTGPSGIGRRWAAVGAAVVLGVNLLAPGLGGPIDVVESARLALAPRPPEADIAQLVGPDEGVLATDWLLPTVSARRQLWTTGDLGSPISPDFDDVDAVLLVIGDHFEDQIRGEGFVTIERRGQAMLLRRPPAQ